MSRLPSQPPQHLPNLPDFTPQQQHRLKTLTFLASAVILVAGVTADYSQGPSGSKPHVFTAVRCCSCCCRSVASTAWVSHHASAASAYVSSQQLGAHVRDLLHTGTGGVLGSPLPEPRGGKQGGGDMKPGVQGR